MIILRFWGSPCILCFCVPLCMSQDPKSWTQKSREIGTNYILMRAAWVIFQVELPGTDRVKDRAWTLRITIHSAEGKLGTRQKKSDVPITTPFLSMEHCSTTCLTQIAVVWCGTILICWGVLCWSYGTMWGWGAMWSDVGCLYSSAI